MTIGCLETLRASSTLKIFMVNDGFNLVAIDDLNTLEQCLLILALREKDQEAATAIADRIKL